MNDWRVGFVSGFVVLSLTAAYPRVAEALNEGVWLQPLSGNWGWGECAVRGRVLRIVQTEQNPPNPSQPPGGGFVHEYDFGFQAGHLAWETDGYVRGKTPFYTAVFDAKGRRVKVSYTNTYNNTPNVTSVENVTYNGQGQLTSLTVKRTNGEHVESKVESKPAADGEVTYSWKYDATPKQTEYIDITFDKAGKLIRYQRSFNESQISDIKYHYNEHGDLQGSDDEGRGGQKSTITCEYVYDTQGNWTKRTETAEEMRAGVKKTWGLGTSTREITYAAKSAGVSQSTQPVSAGSELIGSYHAQTGDPAHDRVYFITLMELKEGGDVTMVSMVPDMQNSGQFIHAWSDGKWTTNGTSVNISLEMGNGKAIGIDDPHKFLNLVIKQGTGHLTAANGPDFKRD